MYNSNDLYNRTLMKVQKSLSHNCNEIEIVLMNGFAGDMKELQDLCNRLEIKKITEQLRSKFPEYTIKSKVSKKQNIENFDIMICHREGCDFYYHLIWNLSFQKVEL